MAVIKLEEYIIFEQHIVAIERRSAITIKVYLVGGESIELHNQEANDFWERFNAEPPPGEYIGK